MTQTTWRQQLGLWRSLIMYYGIPGRQSRMRRCYGQFIRPGDLCFEIGAHVGNRLQTWRTLDARVVAVEPQPLLMKTLRRRYGEDSAITLVEKAIADEPGEATLFVSSRTPTVTSMSSEWIVRVQKDPSFKAVRWDREVTVAVTTLDHLIAQYGEPRFCKIDVEGFELKVLQGLSRPIAALSFEYIPAAISMAMSCIDRLESLGHYEYNLALGETHSLQFARWLTPVEIRAELASVRENSGDVYARCLTLTDTDSRPV